MISSRFNVTTMLMAVLALPTISAQTPDFEKDVLPILKSRCFECHGAPRKDKRGRMKFAKAGLRLDGKDHILAGKVIVPKSPQSSMIVEYTSLPAGDPDIMPPKGSPLAPREVQTIYNWVNDGASFGKWTGAARTGIKTAPALEPGRLAPRIALLNQLGTDLQPLSDSALKALLPKMASIEPVFPGSGLLRVSFVHAKQPLGNDDLKQLSAIAPRIAHLNLAGTAISDGGLVFLSKMSRLVHLDLHRTSVSDKGMKFLAGLKELRYLNLYGTRVGDKGLPHLSMLKRLDALFLWRTEVTTQGLKRLAQMLPTAKISHKLELPAAASPLETGNRRRRKKK